MDTPLLDRTLDLLSTCSMPTDELAQAAGVGQSWLKKLRRDLREGQEVGDLGVTRVQRLHDYLASLPAANTSPDEASQHETAA